MSLWPNDMVALSLWPDLCCGGDQSNELLLEWIVMCDLVLLHAGKYCCKKNLKLRVANAVNTHTAALEQSVRKHTFTVGLYFKDTPELEILIGEKCVRQRQDPGIEEASECVLLAGGEVNKYKKEAGEGKGTFQMI